MKKITPKVFASNVTSATVSALLVGVYVYVAGPVSRSDMNPARTIASAIPANIYTFFWIYMLCPTISMLLAGELYVLKTSKTCG